MAQATGLTVERVAALHAGAEYRVYMYGFAPGFAYLGGLPKDLAVSRRATPRPPHPANALLIGGGLAAVGTFPMPTGWYVIGRTPERLYAPRSGPSRSRSPSATRSPVRGDRRRHLRGSRKPRRRGRDRRPAPGGRMKPRLSILSAGPGVTLQDGGRHGYLRYGITAAGPMDPLAHATANRALGNPLGATALEVSLGGVEVTAEGGPLGIAVAGGAFRLVSTARPCRRPAR